jgi:branched-chain amino acid transport system substrate-binding protein
MSKEKKQAAEGFTRRDFMKTSLIGAAGVVAGGAVGPTILRAQPKPVRIGCVGTHSGPVGMSGEAAFRAVKLWTDEVNQRGGLLGSKVESIFRDSQGKPEEGARIARDYAASGFDFIFAYGSSAEAFAVNAISKELKKPIFVGLGTTDFTADPKVRSPYCFRASSNCLFDSVDSAKYVAAKSKELGLTRWYTISEDYAYGRDTINIFIEFFKKYNPKVEIIGQAWPKLGEPDFTGHITAISNARPHGVFAVLFAADAVSFAKQGSMYGVFDQAKFFLKDQMDYSVIEAIVKSVGKLRAGDYAGVRYLRSFPDTKANHDFCDAHVKAYNGARPQIFSWSNYSGCLFLEAAVKKAKTTDAEAVIKALEGLTVQAPTALGKNGTVTMRARDHQIIYHALGWGVTISEEPYLKDVVACNWDELLAEETEWLEKKGWL